LLTPNPDTLIWLQAINLALHLCFLHFFCWNFGRLCERAQCARYPDSRYILVFIVFVRSSGYFAFIPFHFVVYSIYCIWVFVLLLPFRLPLVLSETTGNLIFILSRSHKRVHLPIWFQHLQHLLLFTHLWESKYHNFVYLLEGYGTRKLK
jgi:hypothetical protein